MRTGSLSEAKKVHYLIENPKSKVLFLKDRLLYVSGWFFGPEGKRAKRIIAQSKNSVFEAEIVERPDVEQQYFSRELSIQRDCGFEIFCDLSRGVKYVVIKAQKDSGKWIKLGSFIVIVQKTKRKKTINSYYQHWLELFDSISPKDQEKIKARITKLSIQPLLSVLMPVYNTPEKYLIESIESVRNQIYSNWELCISDDASSDPAVRRILEDYRRKDPRIKVTFRQINGHMSANSNSALELAEGEFIVLLDSDDLLAPHALYMLVEEINRFPEVCILYSDEDKIDEMGKRYDPFFKPDWNPDLFRSQNLISHLGAYRREVVKKVGGFRIGYEGAQDWDLALRVWEQVGDKAIRHIPYVLYHWRAVSGSTALDIHTKPYAAKSARSAIVDHLARKQIKAVVLPAGPYFEYHRILYDIPKPYPKVSLIMLSAFKHSLVKDCIESILFKTDYKNFELLIVANGPNGTSPEITTYLDQLQKRAQLRVLYDDQSPFNYSKLNNWAAEQVDSNIIGFINDDLEVINPDWLTELMRHICRPEIAAVGAKLFYPQGTIQHAGVVLRVGGVAAHRFSGFSREYSGYFSNALLQQNIGCVTAACMLIKKEVFEEVGKFDENLTIDFGDVDLCCKLISKGYWISWTPYAELIHHESVSRGRQASEYSKKEWVYWREKWGKVLSEDPFYNPCLSLECPYTLAFPPRRKNPWNQ
ncbi:glycosyltransferase family 2 protein [Methylacidiphilum kamchatkense]|uniref:GT2 family glycosyltransferase n=1 Tax=Methylacidiphilum kamchatkense Kam1 TaxID=1202785 RepID=A0A516TJU9_9BACT|nr:glycosyltransferase [Methylacidiphilum kamchatkense]QDQ41531.1 GT2 family glycosyltransferase [Methylacidiphilum kamchatkense Kam1]